MLYRGGIISDAKCSGWFVLEFALLPFSPPLPSVVQLSEQNRHWTSGIRNNSFPVLFLLAWPALPQSPLTAFSPPRPGRQFNQVPKRLPSSEVISEAISGGLWWSKLWNGFRNDFPNGFRKPISKGYLHQLLQLGTDFEFLKSSRKPFWKLIEDDTWLT